jgi:hypothetical protein
MTNGTEEVKRTLFSFLPLGFGRQVSQNRQSGGSKGTEEVKNVGFNFLRSGFGYWLAREPHHFSGLLRRVAPISHKVLTEQLRGLGSKGDGGS